MTMKSTLIEGLELLDDATSYSSPTLAFAFIEKADAISRYKRLVSDPPDAFDLSTQGGAYLSVIRSWIQSSFVNGETVTWGSQENLRPKVNLFPAEFDRLAQRIAAAAIQDFLNGSFKPKSF